MCLRFLTAKPTAFIPGESFSADDAITGKRSKRNAVPSIRIGYHPGTTKLTVSSLEREQVTNDRLQATYYCRGSDGIVPTTGRDSQPTSASTLSSFASFPETSQCR